MTKKKFVSILLVICMLMTLMPTFALADDDGQTPPIVDEQPLTDPTPGDPTNPTDPTGTDGKTSTQQLGTGEGTNGLQGGENQIPVIGAPNSLPRNVGEKNELPALDVVDKILDAAKEKEKDLYFYNVLFANGQDVTVEPDGQTGLLVTVGTQQYSFATSSTSQRKGTTDGLTIFAGVNGSKEEVSTTANGSSTITIKDGAKVGAIFGGGYGNSAIDDVTIKVEQGAAAGAVYGGGLTEYNDSTSIATVAASTITIDGTAGLVYAGGRAAVGPGITDVISFNATAKTVTANNWVGNSIVTINGTVGCYMGGSYSFGGVGTVECELNGSLTDSYSAVCGTNGYRGTATMTVGTNGWIKGDLYCSMRGYVGDTVLKNAGTITRVSLNPDGEVVSSFGDVTVINTGTITNCNLDCGCAKKGVDSNISPYPAKITVDGDVTVSTAYWESNTGQHYTAQKGQTIILLNGAKIAAGEVPPTNIAAVKVGEQYLTLAEAFKQEGITNIQLISDCTLGELITLGEGKDITLDLNGHTITCSTQPKEWEKGAYYAFAVNGGKLTVTDASAAQTGKIIATSDDHNQRMFILQKGDLQLDKGTYQASIACVVIGAGTDNAAYAATPYSHLTVGKDATMNIDYYYAAFVSYDKEKHAYGAVIDFNGTSNNGALYINGSIQDKTGNVPVINVGPQAKVTVTTEGDGAIYAAGYGVWNIQSGSQLTGDGSALAIKAGRVNINGGTLKATGSKVEPPEGWSNGVNGSGAAIQIESNNSYAGDIEIDITNSTISSEKGYSIYEYLANNQTETKVKAITVNSGDFQGNITISEKLGTKIGGESSPFVINGGYFTADPSAYLAADKAAIASDKAGYNFMVAAKPELPDNIEVAVKVEKPDTDVEAIPDEKQEAVKAAVEAIAIPEAPLAAAAGTTASRLTEKQATEARTALAETLGSESVTDTTPVTVVIQPYMEIKAVALDTTANKASLTLEITPMYKTIATTADKVDDIVLADGSINAVEIGKAQKLAVTAPVEITIPLPTGFTINSDTAYVKHTKDNGRVYYHQASVTSEQNVTKVTFTNDKGFSTFEISGQAPSASVTFKKDAGTTEIVVYTLADAQESKAFPTDSKAGYTFNGWTFAGISGTYKALDETLLSQLAALTSPITAEPSFSRNSSSSGSGGSGGGGGGTVSYTITATAGAGGQISPADKVSVTSGSSKTFTITAHTGYVIDDVLVDGKSVGAVGTYTFDKVTKAHTIEARFAQTTGLPFTDVSGSDWFYAPVKYVYNQKLMVGTAADQFSPSAPATRGMIVTMLWRMEGEPALEAAAGFNDVADGDWYAPAVRWAAGQGIVNGYGNGAFGPNDAITREQLAAILSNYAAYKGYSTAARADLSAYTDQPSAWAQSAVQWAVAEKLITGKGSGVLDPTGQATRAEIAAIVMRFITAFGQ